MNSLGRAAPKGVAYPNGPKPKPPFFILAPCGLSI